jgi:hydroxymethylbilane synthase
VPLGGFAQVTGTHLRLRGYVGAPDGARHVSAEIGGLANDAETLGHALAQRLKELGAESILAALAAESA